jgi:hypothetical protein
MDESVSCVTCRFRLAINNTLFQCASYPQGWAHIWSIEPKAYNHRSGCKKYVKGNAHKTGRELEPGEFWTISGKRIRRQDWQAWEERGAK